MASAERHAKGLCIGLLNLDTVVLFPQPLLLGVHQVHPLLSSVEKKIAQSPVAVKITLPDGTTLGSTDPEVSLTIRDRKVIMHVAMGNIGEVASDYVEGRLEIEGGMRPLMRAASSILGTSPTEGNTTTRRAHWLKNLSSRLKHTLASDARQIQFHYDLSDEFYGLWLDPRRVYSCAYYAEPSMNLAQAQEAKLDHICRKLRLRPGERFLDIGAGWGGLLLWAAENYGVDATGITLSRNQHAHVNRLIEERGLKNRVRMLLKDYRELDNSQPWDKIASVGMFEHVGRAHLTNYFSHVGSLLRPGGLIMNHGITAGGTRNTQLGAGMGEFIERYIFPGGDLVHISDVLRSVTDGGLETVDVENLRPHYARTLWAWSDGLEQNLEAARRILPDAKGEKTIRAYRLYLAGCAMSFEHGWISLNQVLCQTSPSGRSDELDHPGDLEYPFRRDYMYVRP